jgi:hypothetical protein
VPLGRMEPIHMAAQHERGEGTDINEDAPVITRDEIVVRAPIETIWKIQTNVDD